MAGRAAAVNAKRRKDQLQRDKKDTSETVASWFDKHDKDADGKLSRDELKGLLEATASTSPSEEALDLAMKLAAAKGADDGITKKVAFDVVGKTTAYVKEQAAIDPIFAEYDKDNSGALDRAELLGVLKTIGKGVEGISEEDITEEDVEIVMELADKDSSGTIEKSEAMFACATWKRLLRDESAPASQKAKKAKSSACMIL